MEAKELLKKIEELIEEKVNKKLNEKKELLEELIEKIVNKKLSEKIGEIVKENEKDNKKIILENEELKRQIKDIKQEYELKVNEYEKNSEKIISENEELKRQLKDIKQGYELKVNEFEKIKKKYNPIETIMKLYDNLSSEIKKNIYNIYGNRSVYSIICSLGNSSNILGMMKFVRNRIIEEKMENINELKEILYISVEIYNNINIENENKYELISCNVGEKFNSDLFSIKGVKTSGNVKKELLKGIRDLKNTKVEYKALIEVE